MLGPLLFILFLNDLPNIFSIDLSVKLFIAIRTIVQCPECDKSYKDRRDLKRHLVDAYNMKFLPGTSLTRVIEGRELDEARSLLHHQQKNGGGEVRRREREPRESPCNFSAAQWDFSEILSVSSSMLHSCVLDFDETNLD